MKKLILLLVILLNVCLVVSAQAIPKGSKITVLNQKNENLSSLETSWLEGAVRDKLESNLMTYTDFSFVDAKNISAVKKLQKQSESSGYNESDAIELGKLVSAKFAVFITIRKSNSNYTIVADVTDLTTGQKRANAVSSPRKSAESLCYGTGCAVDEVTSMLCEKLGVKLTNSQKYSLVYGDVILSNEEQLKQAQELEKNYNEAISKFDAELKRLSISTDLNSRAEKARIESEKALAQEKLKAAQENARRLEEEARKAEQDKKENLARSDEQKKRIAAAEKEAIEKAALVRKGTFESESVFSKISIIESKKKAIVDIQNDVNTRISEIKKSGEEEYNNKKKEIENAPYRAAEKNADGTPSATAKEQRKNEINKKKKEIDERVALECKQVQESVYDTVCELYDDIKKDQDNLSKSKIVSSFDDDLKVQINTFDGKTNAWKITFWLYSNGRPVSNQSINMTYKALTGNEIDTVNKRAYNDFLDTVDFYNSLFSRGVPVLTFELNYRIESLDDYSSKYKIILNDVYVKYTSSRKRKCTLKFSKSEEIYQSKPVYSLKCEVVDLILKAREEVRKAERDRLAREEEQRRIEEYKEYRLDREKEQRMEEEKRKRQKKRDGMIGLIGWLTFFLVLFLFQL